MPSRTVPPASPPPPPNAAPGLMLARVLSVLRPLVRLLVRHGVTYPALAAALKRVFLDAARDELQQRGMAQTDSAVTLLSGVHRRDVRTLTRSARTGVELRAEADGAAPQPGLAAEVVARWLQRSPRAAAGTRRLPRAGDDGFDALVEAVSRDVRPRAVLDELVRLGVARDEGASVLLLRSGFAPERALEVSSMLMAQNLHDHAAAAVANLDGRGNFLEQAVFVDEIGAASAAQLQRAAIEAWKEAFARVMAEAQARFDGDAAELPAAERDHRARFGVYFYSEPMAAPAPAAPAADPRTER